MTSTDLRKLAAALTAVGIKMNEGIDAEERGDVDTAERAKRDALAIFASLAASLDDAQSAVAMALGTVESFQQLAREERLAPLRAAANEAYSRLHAFRPTFLRVGQGITPEQIASASPLVRDALETYSQITKLCVAFDTAQVALFDVEHAASDEPPESPTVVDLSSDEIDQMYKDRA